MTKELFFIGEPFQFKKGIFIYPPKVKQVITEQMFSSFVQILTYSQEEVEDEFMEAKQTLEVYPTPFEYLLNNSYHNKEYEKIAMRAFEFFTHQKVSFLYEAKKIVFGDIENILKSLNSLDDLIFLEESEFFEFQNFIREAVGKDVAKPPEPNLHPRIKEMRRKARYRDKVKLKQKKNGGITLYTCIASICCMGLGITPLNIGEMSYTAISEIMTKYQDKEKYNLDIRQILAGGDSKKINPKYWIRNLEEE